MLCLYYVLCVPCVTLVVLRVTEDKTESKPVRTKTHLLEDCVIFNILSHFFALTGNKKPHNTSVIWALQSTNNVSTSNQNHLSKSTHVQIFS